MALIVEDGTGLSTAESYCSVAFADEYHSARGNTAWTGTEAVKEAALRRASEWLDGMYHPRWKGVRLNVDQGLDWPRFSVVDRDGFTIGADSVPRNLKRATVEMALRALSADIFEDLSNPGTIKELFDKIGPLETKTVYTGGSQTTLYREVQALLADLITTANMVERG